jgi:hypothetical protein
MWKVDDLVEVKVGEVIEGSVASRHLGPEARDAAQRLERFDEQVEVRSRSGSIRDQRPVRDEKPQPASHRRVGDVDAGAGS